MESYYIVINYYIDYINIESAVFSVVMIVLTHNAILDAEAQLVPEIRPANKHHGNRGTPDDVHLDPGLRLQTLRDAGAVKVTFPFEFIPSKRRGEKQSCSRKYFKCDKSKLWKGLKKG